MRTRILPTLIIALALLLGSFFFVFHRTHQARVAEVQRTTAERAGDLVRGELQSYVALMSAALEPISRDPELEKALAANDREALLKRSAPLFEQLRKQFQIDHFYFHATDRTNLLRLHETDHCGDKINRITLQEAQRTGKPASGIEQGPTGNRGSFERHDIEMVRRIDNVPPLPLDKHKVIQILVNLVRNSKQAVVDSGRDDRRITLVLGRVREHGRESLRFQVIDNGVGITPENLTKIFAHGFTTRSDGHGFGLHTAANNAKELGGSLIASSDGPGKGATFTLDLPIEVTARSSPQEVAS